MRFTKENAREFAKRSHSPTSRRNLQPPAEPTPIAPDEPNAQQSVILRQLTEVRESIAQTRSVLKEDSRRGRCPQCHRPFAMEPHHRAALLRSLDLLYDRERILCNIGRPANRRNSNQAAVIDAPFRIMPLPDDPPAQLPPPSIP